jgi:serine/threonine-protein kinase HipA
MTLNKCLVCYDQIKEGSYHPRCSKNLFGKSAPPSLEISMENVEQMAREVLNRRIAVPGVQRKLSLSIEKNENETNRFTVVGALGGSHILKPPTPDYPEMPELENLTMHLAKKVGIKTALHGLIKMKDGAYAYITKRFDRVGAKRKIAVEDLCQLAELPSENKYDSTSEKAGKIIRKYSSNPGDDALRFFEILIFSFLVGNADMHLKNFSLITTADEDVSLSPAYDLLATLLLTTSDHEELALSVSGKKSNLKIESFFALGRNLLIPEKVIAHSIKKQIEARELLEAEIKRSILSDNKKEEFINLIEKRSERLLSR